ncbi:hypothetical protein K439DRAFT_353665 [Ramaria rubella]|nr:hypothetical protein K439DRAFT_353665 [Ramaria rubella]
MIANAAKSQTVQEVWWYHHLSIFRIDPALTVECELYVGIQVLVPTPTSAQYPPCHLCQRRVSSADEGWQPMSFFYLTGQDVTASPREAPNPAQTTFENGVQNFFLVRYLTIAACAWLYFDYFLTVEHEVDLVWKASQTVVKFAFLVYRYASLASITLLVYSMSGEAAGLNDSLSTARPYRRNLETQLEGIRNIGFMLHFCDRCSALNICTSEDKPTSLALPWSAALFFDLVVMAFISFNAVKAARRVPSQAEPQDIRSCSVIVTTLYRDGFFYFTTVAAIRVLNVILTISAPIWLFGLVAVISWPTFAVNLSRFIFRLRQQTEMRKQPVSDFIHLRQEPTSEASRIELQEYCNVDSAGL